MSADAAGRRFGPDSQFCFGTTKLLIQLVLLLFFLPLDSRPSVAYSSHAFHARLRRLIADAMLSKLPEPRSAIEVSSPVNLQ